MSREGRANGSRRPGDGNLVYDDPAFDQFTEGPVEERPAWSHLPLLHVTRCVFEQIRRADCLTARCDLSSP